MSENGVTDFDVNMILSTDDNKAGTASKLQSSVNNETLLITGSDLVQGAV